MSAANATLYYSRWKHYIVLLWQVNHKNSPPLVFLSSVLLPGISFKTAEIYSVIIQNTKKTISCGWYMKIKMHTFLKSLTCAEQESIHNSSQVLLSIQNLTKNDNRKPDNTKPWFNSLVFNPVANRGTARRKSSCHRFHRSFQNKGWPSEASMLHFSNTRWGTTRSPCVVEQRDICV